MDDLLSARLQMAISLAFHIVFAVIGIGLPLLMVLAEWRWIRTGDRVALRLAKQWARGTAILFAVGAVSGTVLSFELGLLWPRFMHHAGAIIGFPFGLEGFAFFTEAIFLGIYLYAWDKINKRAHLGAGIIVCLSGAASAVFVVMVNAWMNTPAGFDYDPATRTFSNIDPVAAMFNPGWKAQAAHMLVAAYLATAFGAAGIHALQLLRNPASTLHRRALAIVMPVAVTAAVLQPIVGDWAAKVVARNQQVKLAAMEGQFQTQRGAPLRIGGLPDEASMTTPYAIEIPGVLSWMSYGSFDTEVRGLADFPRGDWPPVAVTHVAFQVMVACGLAMLAVGGWFAVAAIRRRKHAPGTRVPIGRGLMRALVVCAPLGFVAIEAGWVVTEVGRQPWIINRVMRTSEAVTPMRGLAIPFITFTVIYLGLGAVVVALIASQVRSSHAPDPEDDRPSPHTHAPH